MRNFQTLDVVSDETDTGIFVLSTDDTSGHNPHIALRREGDYVAISANYGALEIALRPKYDELKRTLARLKPVGGLQTSRQIGTGQSYLSVGLQPDNTLLLRPTIVGDASGHITLNLALSAGARAALYQWLNCVPEV